MILAEYSQWNRCFLCCWEWSVGKLPTTTILEELEPNHVTSEYQFGKTGEVEMLQLIELKVFSCLNSLLGDLKFMVDLWFSFMRYT